MATNRQPRSIVASQALRGAAFAARFLLTLALVIVLAACKHH
jgi:hypothetical protein